VGRTIEIYDKNVCPQAEKYHFKWNCSKGKSMARKFTYTGLLEDVGTYVLSLRIINDNAEILYTGSTSLKVVAATTASKSVLVIGDSLSTNKQWLAEMVNLNTSLSFVGTKAFSVADADGNIRTGSTEAQSGWAAVDYIGGSQSPSGRGQTAANLFWDGTRFNWNYYVTNSLSGVSPGIVVIFLGMNSYTTIAANALYIKNIVDYIRQDNATIPIYICYPPFHADQDGIGASGYTKYGWTDYELNRDKVTLLLTMYGLFSAGYTNLYLVPIAQCNDNKYNYGQISTPVNPRSTVTEKLPSEATHPTIYWQFADALFSSISAYIA